MVEPAADALCAEDGVLGADEAAPGAEAVARSVVSGAVVRAGALLECSAPPAWTGTAESERLVASTTIATHAAMPAAGNPHTIHERLCGASTGTTGASSGAVSAFSGPAGVDIGCREARPLAGGCPL